MTSKDIYSKYTHRDTNLPINNPVDNPLDGLQDRPDNKWLVVQPTRIS